MNISPAELNAFIESTYRDAGLPEGTKMAILPKRYALTTTAIPNVAANGSFQGQIPIGANGDFFLTRIEARATQAGATQTLSSQVIPNLRIIFSDSGSDEKWQNAAVDIAQFCMLPVGGGFRDEPFPRVIAGRSTVDVLITSFEAAITPVLDLTFVGVFVKLFSQAPALALITR